MRKSRELLLRFYHDPRFRFSEVTICYIDRGIPGDESCVEGGRIRELTSQYMEIESTAGISPIPYHRITKVLYKGKPVWERGSRKVDSERTGD